jgi:hypothetical protein
MNAKKLLRAIIAVILGGTFGSTSALAAAPRCFLQASVNWVIPATTDTPATILRITGTSTGRYCARANLIYTINAVQGQVLFRQTFPPQSVAPFRDVATPSQMRSALRQWVAQPVNRANFKANLPDWLPGADGPVEREFGFTPAETLTREEYLGIKGDSTPLRCFVQGIESINCVIYHGGVVDPFGIQAFPG